MIKRKQSAEKIMIMLAAIIVVTFSATGCESFRRKFIRKKQVVKKQEVIPVLNPVDYGTGTINPLERYSYHYSMWQVWEKELRQILEQNRSDNEKRQRYLIEQMIIQTEHMGQWLVFSKKEELNKFVNELRAIQLNLKKSEAFKNENQIVRDLRRSGKSMRLHFSPELVKDSLATPEK